MASNFLFSSSPFPNVQKPRKFLLKPRDYPSISCQKQDPNPENHNETSKTHKANKTHFSFLAVPITLTIISSSLSPQPVLAAAAKTGHKKKTQKKTQESLTLDELKQWSKDLPIVSNRIPYTEILSFKESNKLKHVIKAPKACFRERAEAVLVVSDDNKVFRTVLPSLESNKRFWDAWDELKIDTMCVNAYTPPVKKPELPKPYLGFFWKVPEFMLSKFKPKKESKRAMELRKMREEIKRQRKEELARMREEREMIEMIIKIQKKEEQRRIKREIRKKKNKESLLYAQMNSIRMANMWAQLARDRNVSTLLGLVFFVIFYRTVVLSYKKQKKDYEDRLKIEKAEAEERKKMRELEMEMMGIEEEEEEEGEGEGEQGKGEQNAYLKMATQFMKSGARVRRAHNRRLPQYLERGVDVKFSDVAGLGKIRLELEEIVKFFTHGEMYRRRGVRIPGKILKP